MPGCRNSIFVDIHHLHLRSEGGTHHPDLLATLCSAHHAQTHAGRLLIEGTAATGLVFRHADGTPYGGEVNAAKAGRLSEAFDDLLATGLKQGEAKRFLDELRS